MGQDFEAVNQGGARRRPILGALLFPRQMFWARPGRKQRQTLTQVPSGANLAHPPLNHVHYWTMGLNFDHRRNYNMAPGWFTLAGLNPGRVIPQTFKLVLNLKGELHTKFQLVNLRRHSKFQFGPVFSIRRKSGDNDGDTNLLLSIAHLNFYWSTSLDFKCSPCQDSSATRTYLTLATHYCS